MPLPAFLRDKRAIRFAITSLLIVTSAMGAALISAAATQAGEYELASLTSKIALGLSILIAVYVVPRLVQNVRSELLRANLSLNITTAGWVYCIFILVAGISSLGTGNNLLYMILAVLLAALAVSGVISRLNINDLAVSLRFPDHIFANEPAPIEILLSNRKKRAPSFSLALTPLADRESPRLWFRQATESMATARLKKHAPALSQAVHFPLIPARASARASLTCVIGKRGLYPIRGFQLQSRFPFGFVERKRYIEANGEIIVYPAAQPVDDYFHLLPLAQGQMESMLKGDGRELYALRSWQPADHPRTIDWKATARSARMMVREFTRDDDRRVIVALDLNPPTGFQEKDKTAFVDQAEMAITLAASLATHFIQAQTEVRLILGAYDSGFGRDLKHQYALLRQLAVVEILAPRSSDPANIENRHAPADAFAWNLPDRIPDLADGRQSRILITPAARGSIPAGVWRASHVVYFDDLSLAREALPR
ncbi:MAG: DUF58 domain-containing protein [Blastocatellia bacterium]